MAGDIAPVPYIGPVMDGGFTIEESADRLGRFRWWEMRLFELLGSWVELVPELDVKRRFATSSRHHGWHAELLEERLPTVRELSPTAQTVAPSAGIADLVADLAAGGLATTTTERLTVVHRVVLPQLVAAYDDHRDRCSDVADEAVVRTLGFVVADEVADQRVGERALVRLVTVDDLDRLAEFRLGIERRILAAGGITGP